MRTRIEMKLSPLDSLLSAHILDFIAVGQKEPVLGLVENVLLIYL